jgi:hypothetical protein
MKNYLPVKDIALVGWIKNFISQMFTEAPGLSIPATDVDAELAAMQQLLDAMEAADSAIAKAKTAVCLKKQLKNSISKRIRNFVRRVKDDPNCTETTFGLLRIMTMSAKHDLINLKLQLRISSSGRKVRIRFKKQGMRAINIYSRLPGQTEFTFLATVTRSPFTDPRPLAVAGIAELREYYCLPVWNDQEVGQRSEIAVILFKG